MAYFQLFTIGIVIAFRVSSQALERWEFQERPDAENPEILERANRLHPER